MKDAEEWYSFMEPPQSPGFYPYDSPLPIEKEEDMLTLLEINHLQFAYIQNCPRLQSNISP
jgi:hypothetical protein